MTWYEVKKRDIENGYVNAYTATEIWWALYLKMITRPQYDELITMLLQATA